MSRETRSALMSRIKWRDTKPEKAVAQILKGLKLPSESHCRDLPGRPDFVLRGRKLALFVDGDFWHGWRFPAWRHKLSSAWEDKIAATRARDRRNFAKLRRWGWKVLRLWEHQIESDPEKCLSRIIEAVGGQVRK